MMTRCTARSKRTGAQCKRAPHPGAAVCTMHGAAAPQVKRKAEERMRLLLYPAIGAVERAVRCKDPLVALRGAREAFDRIGFPERPDGFTAVQVLSLVRSLTAVFLDVVQDAEQRRRFVVGVRRLLPAAADVEVDDLPAGKSSELEDEELVL
jgi:hypothetical protein